MTSISARFATVRRFLPLGLTLAVLPSCYLMCPYNADQFVETTIRAECHFWFSCCTAGEHSNEAAAVRFAALNKFRDEASCVQERLEEGDDANELIRAVTQAEQAGRFKFDAVTWQTCQQPRIDALNNCDADFVLGDGAPLEVPEACRELPPGAGAVPSDGDCYFDFECAVPGSDCLPPSVLEKFDPEETPPEPDEIIITQPKVCIPPIKEGQSCKFDADFPNLPPTCEPGTICFTQDDGDQECEAPHEKGDDCNTSGDCETGLFCDVDSCDDLHQEGDDCAGDFECDVGLFCDITQAQPECTARLPVKVEICNGVQGVADPTYATRE